MEEARNFIDAFVQEDLSEGNRCYGMQVHTRFPPSRDLWCKDLSS